MPDIQSTGVPARRICWRRCDTSCRNAAVAKPIQMRDFGIRDQHNRTLAGSIIAVSQTAAYVHPCQLVGTRLLLDCRRKNHSVRPNVGNGTIEISSVNHPFSGVSVAGSTLIVRAFHATVSPAKPWCAWSAYGVWVVKPPRPIDHAASRSSLRCCVSGLDIAGC